MKKIGKILIRLLIAYLIVSSIFILFHIDFGQPPEIVGMGFSPAYNKIRIFMGLPPTGTTYNGVPPVYLWQVVIKLILAIIIRLVTNHGRVINASTTERAKAFTKEHKMLVRVATAIFSAVLGIVIGFMVV